MWKYCMKEWLLYISKWCPTECIWGSCFLFNHHISLNWHQFRGLCGQPLSWVKIFHILFSDYKIIKLSQQRFWKIPMVHRRKIKTILPPATHRQPLAWGGTHLRIWGSSRFCVFLGISRDPKATSISTALCIFVGKKEKGNSPWLLHYNNLTIS